MLFRYGHSKVIRLLEHHMGKAGGEKMDATDGRGIFRLRRTATDGQGLLKLRRT